MENCVIGFSGQIGSGKSTLARAVAEELHWPCVSFGSCIRAIALSRGLELSREVLQTLGAELVESDPVNLCKIVVAQSSWKPGNPIVIEGIRHVGILRILEGIVTPLDVRLVFVTAPENLRAERLSIRDDLRTQKLSEQHSTEQDVKSNLKSLASYVIANDQSIKCAACLILSELEASSSALE